MKCGVALGLVGLVCLVSLATPSDAMARNAAQHGANAMRTMSRMKRQSGFFDFITDLIAPFITSMCERVLDMDTSSRALSTRSSRVEANIQRFLPNYRAASSGAQDDGDEDPDVDRGTLKRLAGFFGDLEAEEDGVDPEDRAASIRALDVSDLLLFVQANCAAFIQALETK